MFLRLSLYIISQSLIKQIAIHIAIHTNSWHGSIFHQSNPSEYGPRTFKKWCHRGRSFILNTSIHQASADQLSRKKEFLDFSQAPNLTALHLGPVYHWGKACPLTNGASILQGLHSVSRTIEGILFYSEYHPTSLEITISTRWTPNEEILFKIFFFFFFLQYAYMLAFISTLFPDSSDISPPLVVFCLVNTKNRLFQLIQFDKRFTPGNHV